MIVLRISDGDCIVRRQAQNLKRLAKTRRLADGLRQHHEPAAIEHHHKRQLKPAKYFQYPRGFTSIGIDNHSAGVERNTLSSQLLEEILRCRLCNNRQISTRRETDDRAVFGDDTVHEVQVTGQAPQLLENAARHNQHDNALCAKLTDSFTCRWIESAVLGDRAIVVESEY